MSGCCTSVCNLLVAALAMEVGSHSIGSLACASLEAFFRHRLKKPMDDVWSNIRDALYQSVGWDTPLMRDLKFKAYWNHVDMLQRDACDAKRERHCARRLAEKVEQLERTVRECQQDYADIAAQARRSEKKALALETTVADLRSENADLAAALEDAKRALHDTQAHGDSVGNRDHVAAVIQRAWRKLRGIDVLGQRLLREGNAVKVFQPSDYDADELMQDTWPANVKWQALQRAPAFIQNEPTTNMKFETQRLILARLAGDRGDAVSTPEEMEQCSSMVLTACKVVAGVMGKTHVLSTGARVLEVDGVGAYEASGASTTLMTALDMEASRKGYAAIILLSTPTAVSFYSRFGFEHMQSCSLDLADAARHALHFLSTNAIYRHAPMLKLLL